MQNQGKLIVFEGIDGSGKSTQYRLLCQRCQELGIPFENIVFPRYSEPSSALIRMYLDGAFGENPAEVNPYAASTFYAVDRYASYVTDWGANYKNGGLILSDRYTTSNAVHQGCKLPDDRLPEFFDWLYDLEYTRMGLPKPDLVLYLDVDVETSMTRMEQRRAADGSQADIHEKDTEYLKKCLDLGHKAAAHYGWQVINFKENGEMRSIEEKHEEIFQIVQQVLERD